MVLTKENKAALFDIMQECTTMDDISYLRQLLGLRAKELEASMPKGMAKESSPWWKR